jgi:dephospho-CoA kinase
MSILLSKNNMLKIGITGGIGSGKSTVCRIFEVLDIPVYNSDIQARELMTSEAKLKLKLQSVFGNNVFHSDGRLNSTLLASIVFSDSQKLKILNSIVHPFVLDDFSAWCTKHSNEKYVILESAIIYESNIGHLLDHVIIVDAPAEIRIKRIMDRDKVKSEEVIQRMKNQLNPDEKNNLSKFIIINDGKKSLIDQVLSFHKHFSGL